MNSREFIRKFAEEQDISIKLSTEICESVFGLLSSVLYKEKSDLTIRGFGSFKRKIRQEQKRRHPVTGEIVMLPETEIIKFIPSETKI